MKKINKVFGTCINFVLTAIITVLAFPLVVIAMVAGRAIFLGRKYWPLSNWYAYFVERRKSETGTAEGKRS